MFKPTRVCLVAVALASLVLVLLPLSPGRGWSSVAAGATVNVSMLDYRFQPKDLTVFAGTTVVWKNDGSAPHTATSGGGFWHSGMVSSGQSYPRTFDTPGVYPYNCIFHQGSGMTGSITVVAATTQVYLPFLTKNATGW